MQTKLEVEITIKEEIDDRWKEWFADLEVRRTTTGFTFLTGFAPDQAAVFGILEKIRDLNINLVSIKIQESET
jgi:hypothetical protein